MYPEPLEPGQEFSFMKPLPTIDYRSNRPSIVTAEAYTAHPGPKAMITPDVRLVALDDLYVSVGEAWRVLAEMSDGRAISFHQRIGPEAVRKVFPGCLWRTEQKGAIPVTAVRWPKPTSQSLAIHVRALSSWPPDGSVHSRHNTDRRKILWRQCETLGKLPLSQALALALEWLSPIIDNPAAELRRRGFDM